MYEDLCEVHVGGGDGVGVLKAEWLVYRDYWNKTNLNNLLHHLIIRILIEIPCTFKPSKFEGLNAQYI